METVIPRWEWRTFSADLGPAEGRILARSDGKARTSAETYVLSLDSENNTRIRGRLMDITRLEALDAGLERWLPELKTAFPLDTPVLQKVLQALHVAPPSPVRAACSLEQFLDEIVRPHPRLAAVAVEAERFGGTVGGCLVEVARLRVDGVPLRTAAVEAEDPLAVLVTVRKLGLDGFENVNTVKALKRVREIPVA